MTTILSTKILTPNQKRRIIEKGILLEEHDFIKICFTIFSINKVGDLLLFTSQNAVKSVLKHPQRPLLEGLPVICVGEKTADLLTENGWQVLHYEEYAQKLADYIKKYHQRNHITFFCGNLRRDVLPNMLKDNNISHNEIETYRNVLLSKKITTSHQAVLFFSPSGVESYIDKNTLDGKKCFCIGETTAKEVLKYNENVIISEYTTIESLIDSVLAYYSS